MNIVMVDQIVIRNNGTSDRVFDGHDSFIGSTYDQTVDYGIKRAALEQFNVLSKKIFGNLVMVRTFYSLYGNF